MKLAHSKSSLTLVLLLLLWLGTDVSSWAAEDQIELVGGTILRGKILERSPTTVRIQIEVNGRALIRSFPLDRVRNIVQSEGKETPAPAAATQPGAPDRAPDRAPSSPALSASHPSPSSHPSTPSTAPDLTALIAEAGRTPPSWLADTPLEFPENLDLSWPHPAPKIWNYTRNVDHYLWDIIYSNPKRYPSGVRLMHHLVEINHANTLARARAMNELGRMYFEFFRDHARAAFWWREARVDSDPAFLRTASPARLAECYWRLGDRTLAVELLARLPMTPSVIKAWGDLKETERAVTLAQDALRQNISASEVLLAVGDACRTARDFDRAAAYYQQILDLQPQGELAAAIRRDQDRARDTLESMLFFDTVDLSRIPDDAYDAKSLGYSGNVDVRVEVKAGRVEKITIVHLTDRQYFRAVEETVERILNRQSVRGVDAVSGATVTSEAVIRATAKALAEGMKPAQSPPPE